MTSKQIMPTPETSSTRALSVTDTLRDRIFNREIPPGSHLMEVPLAKELGVSRTPVREALARLADEGLLIYQPNRGFQVRRFDIKDMIDSLTLRATLEGLGCRLVGERGLQPDAQERLLGLLEEQREVLYGEEWNNERALLWQDLNLDFHFALLELADNQWLGDAVLRARQLPIVFDSRSRPHARDALFLLYQRKHSQQGLDEHMRIVDALTRRETTRAEGLMREHILTNRDVLMHALRAEAASDEHAAPRSPLELTTSGDLDDHSIFPDR